jgi:hypothetical protein
MRNGAKEFAERRRSVRRQPFFSSRDCPPSDLVGEERRHKGKFTAACWSRGRRLVSNLGDDLGDALEFFGISSALPIRDIDRFIQEKEESKQPILQA